MYKEFLKNKSNNTWTDYKKQRNYCVELRRSSMKNYLKTKCEKKDSNFWNTVKHFLSKRNKSSENIILSENSRIMNNQKEIPDIMNDYYINVAKDIGQNQNIDITEHPSIIEIKQHSEGNNFQFHYTTREDVLEILKTLNPKKTTGCDQIPAKLLKHAFFQIAPVILNIINKALDVGTSPNIIKKAEVIPVYKKSDKLNKSNYRPVSILPILAKVFEKVIAHQITPFLHVLNIVFSCHLSAFRQGLWLSGHAAHPY